MKMFPESDFYKRKELMFLVVGGNYQNVGNSSSCDNDYLTLCGLRFPLVKGIGIKEEEQNYMRRNQKVFGNFKLELDKKLFDGRSIDQIKKEMEEREDILFFLTQICIPEDYVFADKNVFFKNKESDCNDSMMQEIIGGKCAVINGRIYGLRETVDPVFVLLGKKGYTLEASDKTVEEAESIFQKELFRNLRREVFKESEKMKKYEKQIKDLEETTNSFETMTKISRYSHSYEFGDFGYDFTLRGVFWLIPPHYNKTTSESYKAGQSAVTLTLNKKKLGDRAKFAVREDRNSPFVVSKQSHCLGFSLMGKSLEEKMLYLRKAANNVYLNGAFHE